MGSASTTHSGSALVPRAVDQAIDRIEQGLLLGGERELKSRDIGGLVMQELKDLDQVGYIRFASVYKSFSDAEDFRDAIRDVKKP